LDEQTYSVDGAARVDELEESLGLQLAEDGFPTLGEECSSSFNAGPAWATRLSWGATGLA